ncbi:MAG TPA: hypothetical protein VHO73_09785 [Methylomirabilota bacterium]|nr:hypothetical protein [Methylomirabilota bacterium]
MMRLPASPRSDGLRLATVVAASLLAGAAWAQSQPKFPTPLPTPKPAAPAAPAAPATPAPAAPAESAPAAGTPAPGGPRDPFEPLVRKLEPGEERKVQEVANLKLVGIVWDVKDSEAIRALVETPDGLGYYLRLNEEKFGGKVVALERDRVRFVVREEVPGVGTRERTVELRLSKPEGQ